MATYRKDKQRFLNPADTIFEVVMLADQYGNLVGAANPSGMAVDAFGRARVSNPFTLYESSHRYQDNGKIFTQTAGAGAITHNADASTIEMNVGTAAGDKCYRETPRVFAYQPGKSLLVLITFTMNAPKVGLRQRAGYFGTENGIFLEVLDDVVYFVKRSKSSGVVTETRIPQSEWNMDTLDGTGISQKVLDISKSQIFFTDIEWLGVGSVRCGFVMDGQFVHCHTFHHANQITGSYMTTASLPGRVEIENVAATASPSLYRQVCFSVISEGGYEIRGRGYSEATPNNAPKILTTAGTRYPVISLRLKSNRLDGIAIPKAISMLGIGNNTRIQYQVVAAPDLTGANWVSAGDNSFVEYDLSATAMTGGRVMHQGFLSVTNQSTQAIDLGGDQLFKFQLERNSFTNTPIVLTIAAVGLANGDSVVAGIDWEEA